MSILQELPDVADRLHDHVADITKLEQVEAWIPAVMSRFGRIDGCANVAGSFTCSSSIFPYRYVLCSVTPEASD